MQRNEFISEMQFINIALGKFLTEIAVKIVWFRKNVLLVSFKSRKFTYKLYAYCIYIFL